MIVVDFAAMPRRFAPPAVSPVADIARSYNCTALVACVPGYRFVAATMFSPMSSPCRTALVASGM